MSKKPIEKDSYKLDWTDQEIDDLTPETLRQKLGEKIKSDIPVILKLKNQKRERVRNQMIREITNLIQPTHPNVVVEFGPGLAGICLNVYLDGRLDDGL
tara:strand:- start:401 stop:697 length:297 start_codon:yes stop_codon:yes gene_type:complete